MSIERFSYQVIEIKPAFWGTKLERVSDELTRMGLQGWELVTVLQPTESSPMRLFFKKPH
jgi:hypothetical protein